MLYKCYPGRISGIVVLYANEMSHTADEWQPTDTVISSLLQAIYSIYIYTLYQSTVEAQQFSNS